MVVPTAELHINVEGTLEPEMAFELGRRNGVRLPCDRVEQLRSHYSFRNLQCFGLIACFRRDRGPDQAMATLDAVLAHRDRITGVGLDSPEVGWPPALFTDVFARSRGRPGPQPDG